MQVAEGGGATREIFITIQFNLLVLQFYNFT